jgi:hypothetical protein
MLFVALPTSLQTQLEKYIALSEQCHKRRDPFEVHVVLLNAAVATWRRYIIYLAEEVRKLVRKT